MKILVVSSCTARKKYIHEHQLSEQDFSDPVLRKKREKELKGFGVSALDMYEGDHHMRVKEGLEILGDYARENFEIELAIISAGYGWIKADTIIYPYDATFAGKKKEAIRARAVEMRIEKDFVRSIKDKDLVIVLLGEDYLTTLNLREVDLGNYDARFIFLANKAAKTLIPARDKVYVQETGNESAKRYSTKGIELKGFLFKMLCLLAEKQGLQVFDSLLQKPEKTKTMLDDAFKIHKEEILRNNSPNRVKNSK